MSEQVTSETLAYLREMAESGIQHGRVAHVSPFTLLALIDCAVMLKDVMPELDDRYGSYFEASRALQKLEAL